MTRKIESIKRPLTAMELVRQATETAGAAHRSAVTPEASQYLQPPLTIFELGRRTIVNEALRTHPQPVQDVRGAGPVALPVRTAQDIGMLVRTARESQNLTQQHFADLAGVGRRFVSELENGKPTLEFDKVLQVARTAGIDLSALKR